ncbi:monovalent cation:proton antiporter family protein [Heyndrickxia ginsengihumi]|uniref:monovalent cation:proton antiporter family protein n=1 Tax=Heyndrickxia ginsengihumi TaxID=363870 RepID=UPI002040F028|nr:monovalent cation:proton antiporter family protein [Heyndrickxia ginsengihumi]MCM3025017.1 monovalent cation:proton antiporter family protein [Heyndrickxia ginsengihumi]
MLESSSLFSVVIVMIAAFVTPVVLHRLKLHFIPVVIGEIIVGLIIGKSGFNWIEKDVWLNTLSTLGFIFLMFLSGLEIDFSAFRSKNLQTLSTGKAEPNRLKMAFAVFIGIFIFSFIFSYVFVKCGLIDNLFLMTLMISTISLGVVVPTLKDAHIMKTPIGQLILLVAVIADLATMILLSVFVSLSSKDGGNMWLLLILFAAGVILYFIARLLKSKPFFEKLSTGTAQIGTRAIFCLIIILVALSESVGAENILGAFLAGTLVSLLAPNQEMIRKLDSFGYGFLIPIFFVMVGVDLNIWPLLSNGKLLIFIPLLLIAFFLSKLLPMLLLKKWYDTKTVMASSFLLTSTLSLVIAAAKIAERMNVISAEMSGIFILVAIITCIITPIVFRKLLPKERTQERKQTVAFIGANQWTMPLTLELESAAYEPILIHTKLDKAEQIAESAFNVKEVESYDINILKQKKVLDANIVVFMTGDEEVNAELAKWANEHGVERVIARIETPDLAETLKYTSIEVFSTLLSTKALLRGLIESPHLLDILTSQEASLHEIDMQNRQFEGIPLRKFPFTGDVIIVRIFRGKESIVPHGDTELHINDRLIVTGSEEYVEELRQEMESW